MNIMAFTSTGGRGGLKDKTTMSDRVTPLGTFKVDLILARDARHNAITPAHKARWGDHPTFGELVQEPGKLYVNMSLLDFDGDGVPGVALAAEGGPGPVWAM